MADTYKKVYQGQVGASAAALYTVPAGATAIVKHMRAVNPTGTNRTLTLWHDGSGNAQSILPATTILAGGWGEFDGVILMEPGDTLQGQASVASAITLTVYALEMT